jgi:enoyl-CoA hydratase/carnithine racemase
VELTVDFPLVRIPVPPTLDAATVLALDAAIDVAGNQGSAGVLVLEGTPGVFCRGVDLGALADGGSAAASVHAFARCLEALRLGPCATIAIIDGQAIGGGLGLAAACDVVLATPRSTFGLPELLFGAVPAIVLPILRERVPAQRLRLLALCAHSVSANEAQTLGLVDELVTPERLPHAARRWTRMLSRPQTQAIALLKRYTADVFPLGLNAALERGATLTSERLRDDTVLAAARQFANGELAPWIA